MKILSVLPDSLAAEAGIEPGSRIVAINDWAPGACQNEGQAATAFLPDFQTEAPPTKDVDVVLVLDRSGSMAWPA